MITVVSGAPCAGKSTYVALNAATGDLVVDLDRIADALTAKGLARDAAHGARAAAIDVALAGGKDADAWIIHTRPEPKHLDTYVGAGARLITLDPGYEVCLERAKTERDAETVAAVNDYYGKRP
jgi:hypothetical protein